MKKILLIILGFWVQLIWLGFLLSSVIGAILVLIFKPDLFFMPWREITKGGKGGKGGKG